MTALFVVLGGAAGAPTRWWLDQVVPRRPDGVPWGTVVINVLGSFVLGALLGATTGGDLAVHPWVALIGTGFCGAFTTFSTFGFETVRLAEVGAYSAAARNVVLSLGLGLAAAAAGWWLAQTLLG